jgi:hypothetical protein
MKTLGVLIGLLVATPVGAQGTPHAEVVAAVKASLEARGVNLRECGAFEITRRVAWQLRGEGAGLLAKPYGNNCEGFAVEIIVYPDGRHYDILVDAGGSNGPTWRDAGVIDPSRWRAPVDPDPAPPVVVSPPPPPAPIAAVDLSPVLNQLATIEAELATLRAVQTATAERDAQAHQAIRDDIHSFRQAANNVLKIALKYALPAVAAFFGGKQL